MLHNWGLECSQVYILNGRWLAFLKRVPEALGIAHEHVTTPSGPASDIHWMYLKLATHDAPLWNFQVQEIY